MSLPRRLLPVLACTVMTGLALLGSAGAATAQGGQSRIVQLDLEGVVDPFIASHVESGISAAGTEGAAGVLLLIDTPGGLDSAMRTIIQAVLDSARPVICLVGPEGARAASAGAFILIACPVAAMAPGTNVGAAHPVGISGAIASQKAENDAAAYIRSLAQLRGRNADWAEQAVRESVSASAEEALDLGVIDLISSDVPDLLRDIDGRTVDVAGGGQVTLATTGLTVETREMGWGTALLHALLNPNLAFIFFYLGLALVVLEFFVPGGILGVIGGILLVLSVIALGMLPVQLLGVVLLISSVAFFLLELKLPGNAVGTGLGLATLVLGGLFLFDRSVPSAQVSPWVIAPVAGFAGLFFVFVIRAAIRMRRQRAVSDTRTLLGAEGTVVRMLDPLGVVLVASEEWTAESRSGPILKGARVRVVDVRGLRLHVVPAEQPREAVTPVGSGEGGMG